MQLYQPHTLQVPYKLKDPSRLCSKHFQTFSCATSRSTLRVPCEYKITVRQFFYLGYIYCI